MNNNRDTLNDGARVAGGAGAFLAAILGGFARHADDVGRGVLRHADDFGRAGFHRYDDFSRPGYQSADDFLKRLEVDNSGRLRITAASDDFSRVAKLENNLDDVANESDAVFDAFAHRAAHEALKNAVKLASELEDGHDE